MSSCLSGGAAYSFELEIMKPPPSRAASHNTPSPSSTISESNSPPLAISTRKQRTSRKRPNQTYDEAAALLSMAYPNIFSSTKKTPSDPLFSGIKYDEASHFLLPFNSIKETDFQFNPTIQTKSDHFYEHREINFRADSEVNRYGLFEDFETESILDEEIEEGINSFMGNIESDERENPSNEESEFSGRFGFAGNFGLRSALRENDDSNWWKFSTVEFEQISPRIQTATTSAGDDGQSNAVVGGDKKRKKKKKVAPATVELKSSEDPFSITKPEQRVGPLLKLDYYGVLEDWADKGSPFSDDVLSSDAAGIDIHTKLGEIDLFGESGMREACVLRYKEKRRNRLFSNSKNIRCQARKFNADLRPRIKGRFVRRHKARNLSGLRL